MPEKDYSGTPLPKKLGISESSRIALIGEPEGFREKLEPLPPGVEIRTNLRSRVDIAISFETRAAALRRRFPSLARSIARDGGVWIAWPKKATQLATDIGFETVQEVGLESNLVDNKSCAIDETWQALRFVVRLRDR